MKNLFVIVALVGLVACSNNDNCANCHDQSLDTTLVADTTAVVSDSTVVVDSIPTVAK